MTKGEPHTVPAVHALQVAQFVGRWGVSAEQILTPLGLSAERLSDPRGRISVSELTVVIEAARALAGEPALGVYLGLQMTVSAHGALGFAVMACPTVREALDLAIQFVPTRTSALALRSGTDGDNAVLELVGLGGFGAAEDVVVLAILVGFWKIGEALTGRSLAGTMEIAFDEPPYFARVAPLLRGTARFSSPAHRLVFDARILDLRFRTADPASQRLMKEQCERDMEALDQGGLAPRIRELLGRGGPAFPSLDAAAVALHVSPRTLARRLAAEKTTYSELLDEHRHSEALRLLRTHALSIDDVAERVGYADAAAFTRAFRRWTGTTPAAFRRAGERR